MKKILLIIFLSSSLLNSYAQEIKKLSPTKEQSFEAKIVASLFANYHYKKTAIDDDLSKIMFDSYIKTLDANKSYFLQEDIYYLSRFETRLDDHITIGYLLSAYEIFNTFRDRFKERMEFIEEEIDYQFDFTKDEFLVIDSDSLPYAKTSSELNDRWRKVIKGQALDLKLDGKADSSITKLLKERYERLNEIISDYEGRDVFQLYMNNFAESFDPHTSYFSPITSENFQIRMSQSLEGIGATLTMFKDYTKVASVVAGGPAFESKLIQTDDKIVAVAQGVEGDFVNVIGWRLDDVVQLIRGPKGSLVRLKIIKAGQPVNSGITEEISIVRDKIKLDNQVPIGEIKEVYREGVKYSIGVITIPSFYLEFEAKQKGEEYGSATEDVKKILKDFGSQGIDGVVVDLRSNGGGSLDEAIDLSGLFISKGPVVQVKDYNGRVNVSSDNDESVFYDGPLTVLTNRFSASASEIFSAALKDYKRAVIVGETTYGKGTVQNLISLNRMDENIDIELGQVKMTIAKYYRINGESTQHRGVRPDIQLPSPYKAEEFGESAYPLALAWDEINGTNFSPTDHINEKVIKELNKKHEYRLENSGYLRSLSQDVKESLQYQEQKKISLNYEVRKSENEKLTKERNEFNRLNEDLLKDNAENSNVNSDEKIKDPYLRESIVVLADLISLVGS